MSDPMNTRSPDLPPEPPLPPSEMPRPSDCSRSNRSYTMREADFDAHEEEIRQAAIDCPVDVIRFEED